MYACGLRDYQINPSQAHFVLPETLCEFRSRIDEALMDEMIAIQAAAAMEEGLVNPAHLVIDTFPSEQGSQRVTDATTLYKEQLPRSSRRNPLPVKRINGSLLMSHEHLSRALIELMQMRKTPAGADRVLHDTPEAFDGIEVVATMSR